jgi:prepilin-type N-terminal cleavage/methylation domain-containing protein
MIPIKNLNNGFSLIESVIAIAMVGTIMTAVYALQQAILERSFFNSSRLQRVLLLKNVLYSPEVMRDDSAEKLEKKREIKEPQTTIEVKRATFENQALKDIKTLEIIRATASWEGFWDTESLELGILRFEEPKSGGRT